MTDPKITDALEEWLAEALKDSIANLGYPVGCGEGPTDAHCKAAATAIVKHITEALVHDELVEALKEALEYFESRADVTDGTYGCPEPNEEMLYTQVIRAALAKAGAP